MQFFRFINLLKAMIFTAGFNLINLLYAVWQLVQSFTIENHIVIITVLIASANFSEDIYVAPSSIKTMLFEIPSS